MAAIVDNLIRTKRAAAVIAEDARKTKLAAALPMEIFFAGMTGDSEAVFDWCAARPCQCQGSPARG